jgi:hypothetical protein
MTEMLMRMRMLMRMAFTHYWKIWLISVRFSKRNCFFFFFWLDQSERTFG